VTSVEHIAALLDKGADDVVRYGDRRRRREPLRMLAAQHQFELLAVEPARLLDFALVDDDFIGERLGVTADHERAGKGPGLRGEIGHARAVNADLLAHLAP